MSHKRLLAKALGSPLVLLLLVTCGTPQSTPTPLPPTSAVTSTPALSATPAIVATTRVLFIGNSLTFFNDLPGMFAELARSGGHEVEADMSARGGWTLSDHATSTMTIEKMERQNWDFVVLQEQSVVASIAEERNKQMYPAVRVLDGKSSEGDAAPILFMPWAYRDGLPSAGGKDFGDMQAQLHTGYMDIANELDAMVAPVGIAWQSGMAQNPQPDLWQFDGIHPSIEGTYLTACVFYAVVFQQSPEGLAYRAGLSEEAAQFMQAIAAETVMQDPERWNIP